jgi:hypothetical protein
MTKPKTISVSVEAAKLLGIIPNTEGSVASRLRAKDDPPPEARSGRLQSFTVDQAYAMGYINKRSQGGSLARQIANQNG